MRGGIGYKLSHNFHGAFSFVYHFIQDDPVFYAANRSNWNIDQVNNQTPFNKNSDADVSKPNGSCKIDKMAAYAIIRATTASCKRQMADVACRIYKNTLIPKKLPRFCPTKGKVQ